MVDILGDLARLQKLREAGVLSDSEFDEQKATLLSNYKNSVSDSRLPSDAIDLKQPSTEKNAPSAFTPMDISTIGIFIAALAMFLFLAPATILLYLKFYVILSIMSAIVIYIDARHIDMQGYDWNRAKWGFTTFALSVVTIPIYILKRDEFLEEIVVKYGESISVLIHKFHLMLIYAIVVIVLIYQIVVALNIGNFDTGQSSSAHESSISEDTNKIASSEPSQVTSPKEFTEAEQKIIDDWWETEEGCRGSSDAQLIAQWCARRAITDAALNRAGICYGHEDDASAAEYDIHRCRPGSFGYVSQETKDTACVGFWGHFAATENDVGLSVEIKSSGGFYVQYGDYSNSKGTWKSDPSNSDAAILTDGERGEQFTLEKCASGQPEFTYNNDGQFQVLDKFSGDYWSEAERRGIPLSLDD